MKEIIVKRLGALLSVKSLVTLLLSGVFAYLAITGQYASSSYRRRGRGSGRTSVTALTGKLSTFTTHTSRSPGDTPSSTRTHGARRSSPPSLSNADSRTLCRSSAGARL